MLTFFRNSRPYRIAGVFTLIATIYFAYIALYQQDNKPSINPQLDTRARISWRLLEDKKGYLSSSYTGGGGNFGNMESSSKDEADYDVSSENQNDSPIEAETTTPMTTTNPTANRLSVESQMTGTIHYLDDPLVHKFPPVVPIKCNFDTAASEVLSIEPPKFLPNYKNPCWEEPITTPARLLYRNNGFAHYSASYRNIFKKLRRIYISQEVALSSSSSSSSSSSLSSSSSSVPTRIRCLPYFFISGQPKCGSTDLYNKLISHPHIATPPTKESHWWGKNRYGWCSNYSRFIPFSDYVDLYDHASIEIQSITENSRRRGLDFHPVITGDASVSTLWSNDDWWSNPENCGLTEPLYTNAHYIHRLMPHSRIIIILRNPTDRLYSDYLYFREYKSTTDFHQVVETAIDSLNDCFGTMGVRSCVYNASIAYGSRLRIRIGLYHVFLQEWLSVFPKEQIMVLRLEDYSAEPLETMKKVHKFLGLKELTQEQHEEVMNQPKSNTRRADDKRLGSMMKETRRMLDKFYRPFNVKLARLMNNPDFLWEE